MSERARDVERWWEMEQKENAQGEAWKRKTTWKFVGQILHYKLHMIMCKLPMYFYPFILKMGLCDKLHKKYACFSFN